MFYMPLYFGIIFSGVIRLSKGYDEFEICMDDLPPIFDADRLKKNMKKSVDLCTNFYEYSCGNWRENNPNPEGYVTWSTYKQVQHETFHRIHGLLIKEDEVDELPFIKIAKQYYRSCMNEEAIEHDRLTSIKLMLKETGEWPILMSNEQWYEKNYTWQNTYNTYNELYSFSNIFSLIYKQDKQDKKRKVLQIHSSLKNEVQLLKDTCRHVNEHIMLKVVRYFVTSEGINIPIKKLKTDVNEIITFDSKFRKLTSEEEKTRIRRMTIEELQNFYDSFTNSSVKVNWLNIIQSSFKDINIIINASETVLVNEKFFQEMALLLDVTSPHIIVNYMQWNMVCRLMKYLNKEMRNIESECSNCTVKQQEPRWLTCVQDEGIQDLTSYLYVKTYISADVLNSVTEIVDEIKAEIKEHISLSTWTSNDSKNYMIDKLETALLYIGYPKWYDNETAFIEHYKGLKLGKKYFENLLAIIKHRKKELYTIIKNSNIDLWPIYPTAAAAMYVECENKIIIPATLIQEPFFKSNRPSALNYGAMGFIIGQKLAHSLNMQKIRNWTCLIDYYNNMTTDITNEDGKPVPYGNITLAENINDIIGVQAAFAAFKKNKEKTKQQSKWTLENITQEQLFFLSLASIMCTSTNIRDIQTFTVYNLLKNIRIILSNTKSFSETFKCPMGSSMNPKLKCNIWE